MKKTVVGVLIAVLCVMLLVFAGRMRIQPSASETEAPEAVEESAAGETFAEPSPAPLSSGGILAEKVDGPSLYPATGL